LLFFWNGMEINPIAFVLVLAVLLFDAFGPALIGSSKQAESVAKTASPAAPHEEAHSKEAHKAESAQFEYDGSPDVLEMSKGGRVFVSFCTS